MSELAAGTIFCLVSTNGEEAPRSVYSPVSLWAQLHRLVQKSCQTPKLASPSETKKMCSPLCRKAFRYLKTTNHCWFSGLLTHPKDYPKFLIIMLSSIPIAAACSRSDELYNLLVKSIIDE